MGVEVVHDLPGVGANLQDHAAALVRWPSSTGRRGSRLHPRQRASVRRYASRAFDVVDGGSGGIPALRRRVAVVAVLGCCTAWAARRAWARLLRLVRVLGWVSPSTCSR
nr:hypothetical protein OG781_29005 [Streptomyces sp. NBC_00830]